ncbi:hypothetical protein BRC83_03305 [Halobacteriales archaeon QS_1_68_17]|nr:MAG: hypothetical protein BRC83_03305 [Halobacteriales archaeon QS_1_68_17]
MSPRGGRISRRRLLVGLGGGLVGAGTLSMAADTGAFSSATTPREAAVSIAEPENALVGLDINSPVKKNSRDPLVYVTNNLNVDVTVTITLDTCTDGTLYDNAGNADDCSAADDSTTTATSTIVSGDTGRFDIESNVSGQYIYFDIDASGDGFSLSTQDRTYAESGNVKGAVFIQKFKGLKTNTRGNNNEWTIDIVHVKDDDGDDDLDRVEFEIQEETTTVGTKTITCGCDGGKAYNPGGNPDVTIQPDAPNYTVDSTKSYTATVTGYDADGNYDTDTITTDE